jgi:uncharacterized membrane protein
MLTTLAVVYGVWGWDALTGGCWVTYADEWQRFGWEVGTTYGWMLLSALVALVATGAVVVRLVRQKLATRRAFRQSLLADDHLVRRAAIRVVWYPVVLGARRCPNPRAPLTHHVVVSSAIELAGDLTVDVPPAGWNNLSEYVGWTVGGVVVGLMPLVLAALTIFVEYACRARCHAPVCSRTRFTARPSRMLRACCSSRATRLLRP